MVTDPLVWMSYNRTLNNQISSLYERTLRLVYKLSFHQLSEKDSSVTIHQRNLQTLAIGVFKVQSNIAPEISKDVFEIKK